MGGREWCKSTQLVELRSFLKKHNMQKIKTSVKQMFFMWVEKSRKISKHHKNHEKNKKNMFSLVGRPGVKNVVNRQISVSRAQKHVYFLIFCFFLLGFRRDRNGLARYSCYSFSAKK